MTDKQNTPLAVAAFYKFVKLEGRENLSDFIDGFARERGIRGTILLAPEGINGTIAGDTDAVDQLIEYLRMGNVFGGAFVDLAPKMSTATEMPFLRLRVRLKPEIVTLRAEGVDPTTEVGTYVAPKDWNALISSDDVIVVDTRNKYETAIGTFKGAIDPDTDHFTDFKDFAASELDPEKNKKVAMFCTGGIRCEKASAYMLKLGFEEVFHLEGGILKYLEDVPAEASTWEGSCFVFDERVGVEHGLKQSDHVLCRACRWPLSSTDREHGDFIDGVQCHYCKDSFDDAKRRSVIDRQKQMDLAAKRGEVHMGDGARKASEQRRATKLKQKAHARAKSLDQKKYGR